MPYQPALSCLEPSCSCTHVRSELPCTVRSMVPTLLCSQVQQEALVREATSSSDRYKSQLRDRLQHLGVDYSDSASIEDLESILHALLPPQALARAKAAVDLLQVQLLRDPAAVTNPILRKQRKEAARAAAGSMTTSSPAEVVNAIQLTETMVTHAHAMCGDWPRRDLVASWPSHVAAELATFSWPIRQEDELTRLLFGLAHASPVSVCGGEFTAQCRAENERVYREVTLSVDLRPSLIPGVHACLDMRLVLHRKRWLRAYIFPPCTHQTLSDTTCRRFKEQDGRMFFGILFVIWCYCTLALMLMVEQPDTHVPNFFLQPSQRIRTSELGDKDDKTICLYERGRRRIQRTHPAHSSSTHGLLKDFANSEERDRWRSSWQRFPHLVEAVVAAPQDRLDTSDPSPFQALREAFAVQCGTLLACPFLMITTLVMMPFHYCQKTKRTFMSEGRGMAASCVQLFRVH